MNNKTSKPVRLLMTAALCCAVALIALYSIYMVWERPPEKNGNPLNAKAPAPPRGSAGVVVR